MTLDEFDCANNALAFIREVKSDLMARTDLDAFGKAHRDLSVAKLDIAIGELKQLQNWHFLAECQKAVDACTGNKE